MSTLSKDEILEEMTKPVAVGLVITPCLDPSDQLGNGSVDIRLGNEFIVLRRAELSAFEVLREEAGFKRDLSRYQQRIRKRRGQPFVLHSGEFVLGASLEYLSIPKGLYAHVIGKSSLGRLGLVIATATGVAPGFKGCLTLELSNLGTLPILFYPGIPIAQLVFSRLREGDSYSGRYRCPTGPQFSKFSDRERSFWS